MITCPICEKHSRPHEAIYEDEDWCVTHGPLSSQILGYMYIESRRHVEHWSDFTDEELSKLGILVKRLEIALKQELSIERVYTVTISEAVRHLHVHIIPRESNNDVKGLPLIQQATQQSGPGIISQDEIDNLINRLKERI